MDEATLRVLGVYRPAISKETWQEQWDVTEDDAETEDHFARLVLIEGVVDGLDGPMDFGEFGQMQAEFPDDPSRMMVGYDEGLLCADGETLMARDMDCVKGTGPLRFCGVPAPVRPGAAVVVAGRRGGVSAGEGCTGAVDDAYAVYGTCLRAKPCIRPRNAIHGTSMI